MCRPTGIPNKEWQKLGRTWRMDVDLIKNKAEWRKTCFAFLTKQEKGSLITNYSIGTVLRKAISYIKSDIFQSTFGCRGAVLDWPW